MTWRSNLTFHFQFLVFNSHNSILEHTYERKQFLSILARRAIMALLKHTGTPKFTDACAFQKATQYLSISKNGHFRQHVVNSRLCIIYRLTSPCIKERFALEIKPHMTTLVSIVGQITATRWLKFYFFADTWLPTVLDDVTQDYSSRCI